MRVLRFESVELLVFENFEGQKWFFRLPLVSQIVNFCLSFSDFEFVVVREVTGVGGIVLDDNTRVMGHL